MKNAIPYPIKRKQNIFVLFFILFIVYKRLRKYLTFTLLRAADKKLRVLNQQTLE